MSRSTWALLITALAAVGAGGHYWGGNTAAAVGGGLAALGWLQVFLMCRKQEKEAA